MLLPERSPRVHHASSSSSSYAPSTPKKLFTKFSDNYLADAYKMWTKQPKGPEPPLLCPPGLALDMSPRVKISTVMAQNRKIKNKTVLQKYEKTLTTPCRRRQSLQQRLNNAVRQHFIAMRQRNAIIHERTIRIWTMTIKKEIDPHNRLSFTASRS